MKKHLTTALYTVGIFLSCYSITYATELRQEQATIKEARWEGEGKRPTGDYGIIEESKPVQTVQQSVSPQPGDYGEGLNIQNPIPTPPPTTLPLPPNPLPNPAPKGAVSK